MPNIPVYEQPELGLQPSEVGIEATVQGGYRARALYDQAAQSYERAGREIGGGLQSAGEAAVNYMDHQQITAGAAHGADMLANLTTSWNAFSKKAMETDPNDPTTQQKWSQEVLEPALEQYQKGFTTQRSQEWALRETQAIRTHFFEKTTADMSTMAGAAVASGIERMTTSLSNNAVRDPTSAEFAIDTIDRQIGGMVQSSPMIKPSEAAKIQFEVGEAAKEKIASGAALGAIQHAIDTHGDPNAALAQILNNPKLNKYINGAQEERFLKDAQIAQKQIDMYGRAATAYQKQIDSFNAVAARNKNFSDNVQVDPQDPTKVTVNPKFFTNAARLPGEYPNAPGAADKARTDLDWARRAVEGKLKPTGGDPDVIRDLSDRIFVDDPEEMKTEVRRAQLASDNPLGAKQANLYMKIISEREKNGSYYKDDFVDAMHSARSLVEATTFGAGPAQTLGQDKYLAFQQSFAEEYGRLKAQGKLPPNALNLNDNTSLIRQMLQPYIPSIAQRVWANGGIGAPTQAQAPTNAAKPITIYNKAEYDKLAPGKAFIGADGKPYHKPKLPGQM